MQDSEQGPGALSLAFTEDLYAAYLNNPESVSSEWREYFERLSRDDPFARRPRLGPSFSPFSVFNPPGANGGGNGTLTGRARKMAWLQDRVDQMIRAYRIRGHMVAQLDPLGRPRPAQRELDPAFYGFTEDDLDIPFSSNTIEGPNVLTLREIIARLRNTYCRSIGAQYTHIVDFPTKQWLQDRMEGTENHLRLSTESQVRILTRLTDAVVFEEFIQKKYPGAKSFSLEGAESLIPLLDLAIEKAGDFEVKEIVLAMAHRGRLNVLANIMGKSPGEIFREFEDKNPNLYVGGGDVKYHLGYHNDWVTAGGKEIHLALCFNPSHLEFVNPVALGRVRAKQDRLGDVDREKYLTFLIHGDAAFAGEGIVQETLNMSRLGGYATGGAVHIIVNNQLGFTTPPEEGQSGIYATEVAKMLQSPIFHVNGEDPEAVAQVVDLAMDFRMTFSSDVVIDMYCYRRRGHNETDEPSLTQPLLYREIEKRKSVRDGYLDHLLKLGGVTREQADDIEHSRRRKLEEELTAVRQETPGQGPPRPSILGRVWKNYKGGPDSSVPEVDTAVDRKQLAALLTAQTRLPEGFTLHPKLKRFMEGREEMARGDRPLDWSAAEALAFASLATEGTRVRLTGQDTQRGTFSQRHSVLYDYENGQRYCPLQFLSPDQAPVEIYNSPLSEAGVLGFEYGYSIAYPDALVLWEAQFGDFWNAAQVIVDQFIASAEDKWGSLSGLVMLLPHGFEGMGPEHSSARLERFLLMGAEDNIQVVYPSTPAQYFHVLRRQVVRPWRKPLIIMTPKSLLRHPEVVSSLDDCTEGRFRRVLPDTWEDRTRPVERVLLCSGKIYYEIEKERRDHRCERCAILRLEQLFPLSEETLAEALAPYPEGVPVMWVQEEPENMGAWRYLLTRFGDKLPGKHPFSGMSRPPSASPATGSASSHTFELERLMHGALGEVCLCSQE